ncbi:hypothetical protein PIB30_062502 [Stylosanthes scabra]|uniref:Uncharacterized protein n=1 Tax=Stylosanthes scabra TaxID=79078 RepID=A0ABU6VKP7_9FABA|nr:hypothetical protein [Stylosanthes scabra]
MASSSAPVSVFDEHRFRKEFNQELFNSHARKRKVIPEVGFDLNEDEYPQIMEQVMLRGWRRLAAPHTSVSKLLMQEFYANAAISDEEAAEQDDLPYKSFVRGIKRLRTQLPDASRAACAAIDGAHATKGRKSPNLKAKSGISSLWT